VQSVAWNSTHAEVGHVRAVADDGGVVAVFDDGGASVFLHGALVAHDTKGKGWRSAGVIPSPDGSTRWIVGVDEGGHLRYLKDLSTFEDVSSRYGFRTESVRAAASLGPGNAAFLLDDSVALASGHDVRRFASAPMGEISGGAGRVVGVGKDTVRVLRPADGSAVAFPLPGVIHAAITPSGGVFACTHRALYGSDATGSMSMLYRADHEDLLGLVASGDHVWFLDGGELGLVRGNRVFETRGLSLPRSATLSASPGGDVWVLTDGSLARYKAPDVSRGAWDERVAPVFARACARCHLPGGVSGVDLSTASTWERHRDAIEREVAVDKTMPPKGNPISEDDRRALRAWLESPR
jgi:hypothetical protein